MEVEELWALEIFVLLVSSQAYHLCFHSFHGESRSFAIDCLNGFYGGGKVERLEL
jgi:hypothetical protein